MLDTLTPPATGKSLDDARIERHRARDRAYARGMAAAAVALLHNDDDSLTRAADLLSDACIQVTMLRDRLVEEVSS